MPLPGHTPGALVVFLNNVGGKRVFFVGDAVWNADGITLASHRSKPVSDLVDNDVVITGESIWRLHHLQRRHPEMIIVPAHDGAAMERVSALKERTTHGY